MAHWLLKTEPGTYSFDDLVRDQTTSWDGVTNALAQKHLREFRKGDLAFIYHTGDERAVVGVAEVTAGPAVDPADPAGKLVVVTLKAKRQLPEPVTLSQIKADPAFAGWDLVRLGRLSVVPVPDAMWAQVEVLGGL